MNLNLTLTFQAFYDLNGTSVPKGKGVDWSFFFSCIHFLGVRSVREQNKQRSFPSEETF